MYSTHIRPMATLAILTVASAGVLTRPAAAQERPAPVIEVAGGTFFFPDDSVAKEGFVGGAVRFYVSPRVSVGPEIAFVQGENHTHLILTGNVMFDLLGPTQGRPARVTPFVVVGGGLFQTREEFPQEIFTSSEGAFTAGGGVRASVGNRVFVGAEARIGWELHIRVNGMLGVRLGGMQ